MRLWLETDDEKIPAGQEKEKLGSGCKNLQPFEEIVAKI